MLENRSDGFFYNLFRLRCRCRFLSGDERGQTNQSPPASSPLLLLKLELSYSGRTGAPPIVGSRFGSPSLCPCGASLKPRYSVIKSARMTNIPRKRSINVLPVTDTHWPGFPLNNSFRIHKHLTNDKPADKRNWQGKSRR